MSHRKVGEIHARSLSLYPHLTSRPPFPRLGLLRPRSWTMPHHLLTNSCHPLRPFCYHPTLTPLLLPICTLDPITHSLAYKPVAKKVQLVLAPLEEEYQVLRWLPDNPLASIVPLPTHPPEFIPGVRFTQACSDTLDLNPANWLWPKELKLVRWIVLNHETAFAWILAERGRLDDRYFPPIKIPTVPHTLWVLRNIPIPPSSWDQVIQIIKD